jgi:hypothetical protein
MGWQSLEGRPPLCGGGGGGGGVVITGVQWERWACCCLNGFLWPLTLLPILSLHHHRRAASIFIDEPPLLLPAWGAQGQGGDWWSQVLHAPVTLRLRDLSKPAGLSSD